MLQNSTIGQKEDKFCVCVCFFVFVFVFVSVSLFVCVCVCLYIRCTKDNFICSLDE